MSQAVTPTHRVPHGGLPAWPQADSSSDPAATLDPGLELQVLSRWGDWAYIRCTNGWCAWVDGRRLQPMYQQAPVQNTATYQQVAQQQPAAYQQPRTYPPAQAVPQRAAGGSTINIGGREVAVTALGGAVLVVIGAMLSWFSITGAPSANSFDIAAKFLFDPKAAASGFDLGWLIALGAVVGGALAVFRPTGNELKSVGSVVTGLSVLYVVQLQRYLSLFPADGRPGLFSTIGIGVYVTIVGAVLMVVRIPLAGRR